MYLFVLQFHERGIGCKSRYFAAIVQMLFKISLFPKTDYFIFSFSDFELNCHGFNALA